ncbi:MAG: GTPase HflX [Candidatus Omnitrophica bacterium]|nr:GTPase HflX [Candidatus Omnitrophota bacterium]
MEKVITVTVKLKDALNDWSLDSLSEELKLLTRTVNGEIVGEIKCNRHYPTPSLYLGTGKIEELSVLAKQVKAQTVVFNNDLSPIQQKNIEDAIGCKTIDRTQLILDIFARHAKTQEGKIQVELAQLQYLLPRLMGKGIALSRLGGGIGTRGPGEQKLEIDRRRIRKRIDSLKKDIKALEIRRLHLRKRRTENALSTIALVGYTNAGKSTLLNALSSAHVKAKNEMFSTLDPLTKRVTLPTNNLKVLISDTVGFLNKLPHHLIDAFKATLEEIRQADMLIVVLDVSSELIVQHHDAIWQVLIELEAQDKPIIYALNKIDNFEEGDDQAEGNRIIERFKRNFSNSAAISAKCKKNIPQLIETVEQNLINTATLVKVFLKYDKISLINTLHEQGKVMQCEYRSDGVYIEAKLPVLIAKKVLTKI